jgi:Family of unknown function (DUF6295)
MCTWITEKTAVTAYGKGVPEWIELTTANVYYDHPVSAPLDHALIIDFLNEAAGPGARVAVELSAESARALVRAIETALVAGEECHSGAPARVERANASDPGRGGDGVSGVVEPAAVAGVSLG